MSHQLIRAIQGQLDAIDLSHDVRTWWRIFSFDEKTGEIRHLIEKANLIPYQGADVLARALGGDPDYVAGAMYFEFENTAGSPSVPTPDRDEDISYYLDTLALSSTKDYVRAPLVIPAGYSSSDSAKYAGNQVTFFATTSGTQGVHGRAFSSAANSKVYGVALAATPESTQYTSDLLFSRTYDNVGVIPKEDGYQIGAQYLIRFL